MTDSYPNPTQSLSEGVTAGRLVKIGQLGVRRMLPSGRLRKFGPWVFFDHVGPASLTLNPSMDVRPHPHCGLSTVTWFWKGEMIHRDSLGHVRRIVPGELAWMRSGHGIVHSERFPPELHGQTVEMEGVQLWCAHPDGEEEQEPSFQVWSELPSFNEGACQVHLHAGHGWGRESPVHVTSPLVFASVEIPAGGAVKSPDHEECCIYVMEGSVTVGERLLAAHQLCGVERRSAEVTSAHGARVVFLGGDAIGPRRLWWNLVHSDPQRLVEQAERWRRGEFPEIPGDNEDVVPAPPGPR